MKKEIIALRKQIFNSLKQKAMAYEGFLSQEISQYKDDQDLLSKKEFSQSNIDELLTKVKSSRVTYLGDFHTFDQNIRNVLRVLKYLLEENKDCIIALEMVDAKFQFYIDTYLEGHITDLEFLESIEYHDSWRFPWSHYKLIFELAKNNSLKIVALNSEGTLPERDLFAAKIISQIIEQQQKSHVLVLYGELHIVQDKIPSLVQKEHPQIKSTIIHQNLDQVYWKQIEKNHSFEIVKFNQDEFCINSAPPWIKYESMIYWYENLCDDPDFDIHEYIIESGGKKIFSEDTGDNFFLMCKQLIETTSLQITEDKVQDYNLYDHSKLDYIIESILPNLDPKLKSFYEQLIAEGLSFKLPKQNSYYCSSYSVNRLAYLCGIHIFSHYCKKQNIDQEEVLINSKEESLILLSLNYLYAYFFSKIINPHRKCALYLDFVTAQRERPIYKEVKNILDEKQLSDRVQSLELDQINEISMYLGHLLGDYLYNLIIKYPNDVQIESLLKQVKLDDFSFQKLKQQLLHRFDYKKHNKRYF